MRRLFSSLDDDGCGRVRRIQRPVHTEEVTFVLEGAIAAAHDLGGRLPKPAGERGRWRAHTPRGRECSLDAYRVAPLRMKAPINPSQARRQILFRSAEASPTTLWTSASLSYAVT